MKVVVVSLLAVVVMACGSSKNELNGMTEQQLTAGFNQLIDQFNSSYNDEGSKDSLGLVQINDSLKLYVEALSAKDSTLSVLPNCYFLFGETSMKLKNSELALQYFNALINSFPNSEDVPMALYNKAYTYENVLSDTDKAIETYKYLYKTYPDTKWAENARSQVLYLNNPSFIGE